MNILFIHSLDDIQSTKKPLQNQEQMQFGISYISSFLKRHGHDTRLVVLSRAAGKKNKQVVDKAIKEFNPGLIGFTAVATEYPFIAEIAKYIKGQYKEIHLLIGGPHTSLNPQEVIQDDFDSLCIGEGENPTLELISQLEKGRPPSDIPNLWIKRGSEVEKNSTRPFLQDVDNLPFPDREMWQEWVFDNAPARCSILLGRGCPFQCTYCCNHALKRLAEGTYVRYRSPENIVDEIKDILVVLPTIREIYLEIETIGVNKEWALELCSKLRELNATLKHPLTFGANIRVIPQVDWEELFSAFEKSNFKFINIGLESGSEKVRRQILRRYYSNRDVVDIVMLAKKHGLRLHLYNMVGLPGETLEDFKETIKVNRECMPDLNLTSIFFPYPGTDLFFLCKDWGLLKNKLDTRRERKKAVLDLPGFSKKQIQKSYVWFDYYVYKGHKPMHKILPKILRARLEGNYYLNSFYRRLTCLEVFRQMKGAFKKY